MAQSNRGICKIYAQKWEYLKIGRILKIKVEKFSGFLKFGMDDKLVAAAVGAIFFLIIMCLAAYKVSNGSKHELNNDIKSAFHIKVEDNIIPYCVLNEEECSLTCTNFRSLYDVEEEIKDMQSLSNCMKTKNLKIELITDMETKITSNLLQDCNVKVQRLSLHGIGITQIEDEAFSSNSLKTISELILRGTNVSYFSKNTFKGFLSLDMFLLLCPESSKIQPNFDQGFLQPVQTTLTTLQLTGCVLSPDVIENLINTNVNLTNLKTLDLGYSYLESLKANSFISTSNLVQLFLRNANLKHLEVGVFNKLSSIQQIHLEENKLTTLGEGIFNDIKHNLELQIHIQENPWNCTCDLEWLKNDYMTYKYLNKDIKPTCENKGCNIFDNVTFCEETTTDYVTTIIPESTSHTTLATITEIPSETTSMNIIETTSYLSTKIPITTTDTIYVDHTDCSESTDQKVQINKEYFSIILCELAEFSKPIIKIIMKQYTSGSKLIWFDNTNITLIFDILAEKESIDVNPVKFDTVYNVCVVQNNMMSPSNCFGFKTRKEYSKRAWIINKFKNLVLISSLIAVLVLIVVTVAGTYWCIRLHPKLIRGNERVVIIDIQRPENVLSSNSNEFCCYSPPSSDSILSTGSTFGSTGERSDLSYITPMTISSEELCYWREQNLSSYPCRRHIFPLSE